MSNPEADAVANLPINNPPKVLIEAEEEAIYELIEPGSGPQLRELLSQPVYQGVNICSIQGATLEEQGRKQNGIITDGDCITVFLPEAAAQTLDIEVISAILDFDRPNFLQRDALISISESRFLETGTPERQACLRYLVEQGMDLNTVRFQNKPLYQKRLLEMNPELDLRTSFQNSIYWRLRDDFEVFVERTEGLRGPDIGVKSVGARPKDAREWGEWVEGQLESVDNKIFAEYLGLVYHPRGIVVPPQLM